MPQTMMVRKDSEKDSDRPHYYSQFWLDVAAGRRIIGAPKTGEEAEIAETEAFDAVSVHKAEQGREEQESRVSQAPRSDERAGADARSTVVPTETEKVAEPESDQVVESDIEEIPQTAEEEEATEQESVSDSDIPDVDLGSADEEEEDEDFYDEEEGEEEEEEDIGWGGRGSRKKPRPGRTKLARKHGKREQRRSY
ncbi:MAG: hypothetical protein IMW89_01360 [Ktedonobacteraceae bacterium]|nr:hypothetical protein [Ktedonobacteraceae bacterium]